MTEAEWLASSNPAAMLAELESEGQQLRWNGGKRISDRKLRLWIVACARKTLRYNADGRFGIDVAERFADGQATSRERGLAMNAADNLAGPLRNWAYACLRADATHGANDIFRMMIDGHGRIRAGQADLLREIAGNVFDPIVRVDRPCPVCKQGWIGSRPDSGGSCCCVCVHCFVALRMELLTPTVTSLATAAYEQRIGRRCEKCHGRGKCHAMQEVIVPTRQSTRPLSMFTTEQQHLLVRCDNCNGTCRIEDGTLDPARLAVLADALEEGGCCAICKTCGGTGQISQEHPWGDTFVTEYLTCHDCLGEKFVPHPVVAHLRTPGPHVRGCWALDLTLGKE